MDPKAALLGGNYAAYNEWRSRGGFCASGTVKGAPWPHCNDKRERRDEDTHAVLITRVYRGHRCWRARVVRADRATVGGWYVNLAEVSLSSTSWIWRKRAGKRARWHHEAPDWLRSGKALCGADLNATAWEWSDDIRPVGRKRLLQPPQRFGGVCKRCLARLAS